MGAVGVVTIVAMLVIVLGVDCNHLIVVGRDGLCGLCVRIWLLSGLSDWSWWLCKECLGGLRDVGTVELYIL